MRLRKFIAALALVAGTASAAGDFPAAQRVNVVKQSFDVSTFGPLVAMPRISQISVNWSNSTSANAVTSTVTGTGSTGVANGIATMATGTGVTSSAKLNTETHISYVAGREIYGQFTAAFTTPTSAASDQRAGIYDANNGIFIGYHGTSFGVTVRSGGVDTFTAASAFSEDHLTGAVHSQFTRQNVPEAVDFTKYNVWRIRYGWLGSAPITFEVLSPDGPWVVYNIIRYPNTAVTPSVQATDVPVTMEVIKSSSDATNLQMLSSSWDAGIVDAQLAPPDKVTYAAGIQGLVAASSATDVFTITGSATKTVKIIKVGFSGTETTGAMRDILLIKRSTANSGGTSSTVTAVPYDSASVAATATVRAYTVNPTLGTTIGNVKASHIEVPATNLSTTDKPFWWSFGTEELQPIILRGVNEVLAINLNATTLSGSSLNIDIEWTEQ